MPESTIDRHAFRRAVEAGKIDDMVACFAPDAVLHSPVTFQPFEGREAIARLLAILSEVFEEFRYTDELAAGDGTMGLIFRTRVGGRKVEGLDLIRFAKDGRIRDFTVMVRPRSAVEALMEAVGARLAGSRE